MLKTLKNLAGMFGAVAKEVTAPSDDPRKQLLRSNSLWVCEQKSQGAPIESGAGSQLAYSAVPARFSLSDVHGMSVVTDQIVSALRKASTANDPSPKNGLLLYGPPGVGKTFLLECCAGEVGLPIVWLTIGGANSMWVGEKTKNVKQAFDDARAQAPCLLFIDEIDSFLVKRENIVNADSEAGLVVNTFLTELDSLRGSGVVVAGATNFVDRLDAASVREGRFDWKVFIPHPDSAAREALIREVLGKNSMHLEDKAVAAFVQHWEGFSVARILAIVREACSQSPGEALSIECVTQAWMKVRGAPQSTHRENQPSIQDLILDDDLRTGLTGLARRMRNFVDIGIRGGTVPRGVLFYGPPGTGKTLAARALAKDSGWSVIALRGVDLMASPEKIDSAISEAIDYRPSIVFIDEADDVLADRSNSLAAPITNKLLQIIDGGDSKLNDVLFVAATNYPERLDPAMLRGGRFGLHLQFNRPSREMVSTFVQGWLSSKGVSEGVALTEDVLNLLEGMTLADVREQLQLVLNSSLDAGKDFDWNFLIPRDRLHQI